MCMVNKSSDWCITWEPWKPNYCFFVCLMVFNATFNNISVISWRSVLLVEETRGPGENHGPVASHWQILSHNVDHMVDWSTATYVIRAYHHQRWFDMVFIATFNNISVISWRSVLLVEETGVLREKPSHWQTLSRNVASSTPHH
jgi:energy-converting hydrogenase Eha subunit E